MYETHNQQVSLNWLFTGFRVGVSSEAQNESQNGWDEDPEEGEERAKRERGFETVVDGLATCPTGFLDARATLVTARGTAFATDHHG